MAGKVMISIVILVAVAAVEVAVVVCRPNLLARNEFLQVFASHEALSLLAVVLTVTLASVANIHLAVNRIISERFSDNRKAVSLANEIKSELRQNCWIIFAAFLTTILLLLWKGAFPNEELVLAIVHGGVVWIFFLNLAAMYDVYRVVFGFAALGAAKNDDDDIVPSEGA